MLSSTLVQASVSSESPTLDQVRTSCLLAFYEFHQCPTYQAWIRIGNLTRTALWLGLDRLDLARTHSIQRLAMTDEELFQWRSIWWVIYCLDSYVNLSFGTPYLIDERLVRTALLYDPPSDPANLGQDGALSRRMFLPSEPERLPELASQVASLPQQSNTLLFNIHILTTTCLRQVGRVQRQDLLSPPDEVLLSLAELEQRTHALRLSLPANHFNSTRNVFQNETSSEHHARLPTVLHYLMARLLLTLMKCSRLHGRQEWLLSWQEVLEICQDIVGVSEKWNTSYTLRVDPAMSFIVFTALIFLELHKKFAASSNPALVSRIAHSENILVLLLEHFANTWSLPRLLSRRFGQDYYDYEDVAHTTLSVLQRLQRAAAGSS